VRGKQPDVPGNAYSVVDREKLSEHNVPARERLIIDRRHPDKTVKDHHVEEEQWDGSWTVVHEEHEESPSTRRGQAKKQAKNKESMPHA